jgi:hypothetical protein
LVFKLYSSVNGLSVHIVLHSPVPHTCGYYDFTESAVCVPLHWLWAMWVALNSKIWESKADSTLNLHLAWLGTAPSSSRPIHFPENDKLHSSAFHHFDKIPESISKKHASSFSSGLDFFLSSLNYLQLLFIELWSQNMLHKN